MALAGLLVLFLVCFSTPRTKANHNYGEALTKSILFFHGQRSGKLPPGQGIRWRGDSALRDGSMMGVSFLCCFDTDLWRQGYQLVEEFCKGTNLYHLEVDLVGGYYDAGDNVKFGFPMAFTITMLAWSVIEFGNFMGMEHNNARASIRWGTDYFLKATAHPGKMFVQVGNPISDHNCWERPEDMDTARTVYSINTENPGSDVAAETAAALAASSIVFRASDPSYSNLLLNRAIQVFEFADRYRGAYSDSLRKGVCPFYCDFDGYQDELLWGAAWLHGATGQSSYLVYIQQNGRSLGADDNINEFGWDNKHAGINILVAKEFMTGKAWFLQDYKEHADDFICSLLPETASSERVQYTPGGLLYKPGGSNMQHVTAMSFLLLTYANYLLQSPSKQVSCGATSASPSKLRQLARRQVDYILGDNPMRMSYMVGYGSNYPKYIHHRGSSLPSIFRHPSHITCQGGSSFFRSGEPNPNLLVGAVVGGPGLDDRYSDVRSTFRQSEPTTYINAPLVGVLAFFFAHPNPS